MKPVMKRPKHARVGNNPRTKTNLIPYSVVYALSHERLEDKKYELNFRVTSPIVCSWPMADVVAKGGIGRLRVPRVASGTRNVSMRGLIGSRRVPST